MSVVGTLRHNKRFIPAEFQDPKLTEKGQPKFCFQKDAMLVSYKSGANKNVILLSSMHSNSTIVVNKHEKELPEVVSYYNSTKGGVDTMDLMAHTVSSKRQTKRWPMLMFYNIIDVGSIAALVVYSTKYPVEKFSKTDNRREFQLNVSKDLILPQIERRRQTDCQSNLLLPWTFFSALTRCRYQHPPNLLLSMPLHRLLPNESDVPDAPENWTKKHLFIAPNAMFLFAKNTQLSFVLSVESNSILVLFNLKVLKLFVSVYFS
ncbi:PiggyBac transposable element-derived protein 4 [Plakobranchus ocellatus]|uniref:PiggyBac transposable element-derived protein 4 n=1 Tax=Plakobranchus ocellatus TaxID=259542 RepID=A0AAV3Y143_9GAST|nr:PiggyBac transposable element-derived protein 4 [Plakobranchus ocellatus]